MQLLTKTLIEKCDVAVVRFGDKFKQWNAAFDAGCCAALGKPYITLHDEEIIHPMNALLGYVPSRPYTDTLENTLQ